LALLALSLIAAADVRTSPLRADVSVQGDVAAVRLDARGADVAEAFAALETAFHVRIRSPVPIDREIHGSFTGRLDYVIARLLEGYNYYVVRRDDAALEVVVLGTTGKRPVVAERPKRSRAYDPEWEQMKARHRRPH
jgi:hypothetical protein